VAGAYVDWQMTPGVHTYGVAAIDIAGNVGPTVTVLATVPAPVAPTPTSSSPTTGKGTTGTDDSTPDGMTKIFKQIRLAKGVAMHVLARHGRTRRVRVSWTRTKGTHTYTVMRNGRKVAATRGATWVDAAAPTGALRYTVRVS
jgi:hypothetical protein